MKKAFEMDLFLSGVLTGSKVTQQRHLRQARSIQTAINQRWHRDNPWSWKTKHLNWFFICHLKNHSNKTRYYYYLTIKLIQKRTGRSFLSQTNFTIKPSTPLLRTTTDKDKKFSP